MWLYKLTVSMRPVWSLYWRFRIAGAVDAIPSDGPLIVTANHASFLDPWFLAVTFPRPMSYLMTSKWYHRSKLWEAFFRANGTVPVRASDPRATVGDLCGFLDGGRAIGIFPEGRISADGRIRRFRTGFARVAARSGAPLVPVGIRGSVESLPRNKLLPRPGTITVHVGEPVVFPGSPHETDPPREHVLEFRRRIFEEVCRLAGREPAETAPTPDPVPAE